MSDTDTQQHFSKVAQHTLDVFDDIAPSVEVGHDPYQIDAGSLTPNTFNNPNAIQAATLQNEERLRVQLVLSEEPAIARVVVRNEKGELETYFISRVAPPRPQSRGSKLASANSVLGRIASLPPGSEFEYVVPAGPRALEIVERALLHPARDQNEWDSKDTRLEGASFGTVTVLSLKALLKRAIADDDVDAIEALLAEEEARGNVIEGIRRNVISKMALRDQPILDQFQDAIFRLPLNRRLLVVGPPGTGKTTTLIRRLGQKIDTQYLEEDEKRLVRETPLTTAHEQSWLMFTPTKLLKYYVKEAFAKQGVAASDQRIVTWKDHRHSLARERFSVLRTGNGGGPFTMPDGARTLAEQTLSDETGWFEDFNAWQDTQFWRTLDASSAVLSQSTEPAIANLGKRLAAILARRPAGQVAETYLAIAAEGEEVRGIVSGLKAASDKILQKSINIAANTNKTFLNELAAQIALLRDTGDDGEEDAIEDEELPAASSNELRQAFQTYNRVVRNRARAETAGRSIAKSSFTGKLLEWLADRIPPKEDRVTLGQSLRIQDACRTFQNPLNRYLSGVPRRYRQFRRERLEQGKWYAPSGFAATEVMAQEVDLILLSILRTAGQLLTDRRIIATIDQPDFAALSGIRDIFKNQIMVDEATDFSPLELACMGALSNPAIGSFFACGDFNQRITDRGVKSEQEVRWGFPDIEIQSITTTYRHSKQLNDFAKAIVRISSGGETAAVLPDHVEADADRPVFGSQLRTLGEQVSWLAQRIVEIERKLKKLPSIAILTTSEEQIQPLAAALNEALSQFSMPVVPCPMGMVVGEDSDIRVFNVEHIKGLEFEAVFFVGIDSLATNNPGLFDKYLYVGATRAATYLGLTSSSDKLPDRITALSTHFGNDWQ